MTDIYPVIRYRDAHAGIDFLVDAFGFSKHAVYEGDDGVDIALDRFRIGTGAMRGFDQLAGDLATDAGNADVQPRGERIAVVAVAQVDLGIDREIGRQGNALGPGGNAHRAFEAGGPACGEKLLGVGARAGAAG